MTASLSRLLLGAAVQLLGFGRWMTRIAAWLALAVGFAIRLRGIVPMPGGARGVSGARGCGSRGLGVLDNEQAVACSAT